MLDLCQKLISHLSERNIDYCHWKSNLLLVEAMGGYDDLDLLVAKEDAAAFKACIFDLNFVEGGNSMTVTPSVKHYYGYDVNSGKVLLLHVYYRLLTGASWIKDLVLGVEKKMLASKILHPSGIYIPPKYMERVIFVLRCMFKYSLPNEVFLIEQEKERVIKELEFLTNGNNLEKETKFIDQAFPALDYGFFLQCVEAIKAQDKS